MTRQTTARAGFQKRPTSPNIRPRRAETSPRAVNVAASPRTKNNENKNVLLRPPDSLRPATRPIIRGIMARTQGLEAVITPPRNTAGIASQGLFWRIRPISPKSAFISRVDLQRTPCFFRKATSSSLGNRPTWRKISFPVLSIKTWVGMSWMPYFRPGSGFFQTS